MTTSQIRLGGQTVDLKGLSVADGEKIYRALPENYRQHADQYAAIAKQFERVAAVQLPHGMTLQQAFANYKNALIGGAGKLKGESDPYLQQIDALCRTMPGYGGMVDGLTGAAGVASFAGTAIGAAKDTALIPARFLFDFLPAVTREGWNAATPGISDAQARTFGTAYAAALYAQGAARQGMTTGQLIWNYPGSAFMGTLESTPLLRDALPFLYAAFKWVSSFVTHIGDQSGEKALTFTEALGQAKEELSHTARGTWRETVEARAEGKDFDAATATMKAAEVVAGVSTLPLADAIQNGGTIINNQGNLTQVSRQGSNVNAEQPKLTGPDGKPLGGVTRADRVKESAGNLWGATGHNLVNHLTPLTVAGVGVGVAALNKGIPGGYVALPQHAVNGLKGIENAVRGVHAGYLEGTADTVDAFGEGKIRGGAFAQSHNLLNKIDKLKLDETAAHEKVKILEGQPIREGRVRGGLDRFGLKRAESQWENVAQKLETAEGKLTQGPRMPTHKFAEDALKLSDTATEVMGSANASRLGVAFRGGSRLLGRVAPWASGLFAAKDTVDGCNELTAGKNREAAQSFASAGTVASGAAIGAGVGVWFGGIGAVPGAITGAGIAGLVDFTSGIFGLGSRDVAGQVYDRVHRVPVKPMQPLTASPAEAHPGLALAAIEQHDKTQAAHAQAKTVRMNVKDVQLVALVPAASGGASIPGKVTSVPQLTL